MRPCPICVRITYEQYCWKCERLQELAHDLTITLAEARAIIKAEEDERKVRQFEIKNENKGEMK